MLETEGSSSLVDSPSPETLQPHAHDPFSYLETGTVTEFRTVTI